MQADLFRGVPDLFPQAVIQLGFSWSRSGPKDRFKRSVVFSERNLEKAVVVQTLPDLEQRTYAESPKRCDATISPLGRLVLDNVSLQIVSRPIDLRRLEVEEKVCEPRP